MLAPLQPRVIRAARGPSLSARSWTTEAPLRMLMNNLDPQVAENPTELVVYGGIGRAARDWNCYDRIVETLKTLSDEETLLIQSGKPVGVFPTHAGRAARAHREFQSRAALGHLGALSRTGPQGSRDVRSDDRGFVDLHRQPGHRPGDLRNLRRDGASAVRRQSRRQVDPDRGFGGHGRRAAARRDHGGRPYA